MNLAKMTDKNQLTVIQEHPLFYNYSPYFEDFSILTTESIMTSNLKQKTVY